MPEIKIVISGVGQKEIEVSIKTGDGHSAFNQDKYDASIMPKSLITP